jgi:hypothetical protein
MQNLGGKIFFISDQLEDPENGRITIGWILVK